MDRRADAAQNISMAANPMTSLAKVTAAACVCLATPALAQVQVPSTPPGEARAEGDALIAQAGAADLFDNLTGQNAADIKLLHKASGLICAFNPGQPANRVVVFDTAVRGDEIACSTAGAVGERTLYASRAPGRTLADAFARDLAQVKKSHPGAQDYALPQGTDSPFLAMLNIPPMPASKTARFIADHQFTSVSSAMVGDWALEFRFTCPEENDDVAAATAQPTLWVTILAQISKAPLDLALPKEAI